MVCNLLELQMEGILQCFKIKRAMCLPSFFPAAILFCSALQLNNDMDEEKIIAQLNKSILQTRNVLNLAQYFKSQ